MQLSCNVYVNLTKVCSQAKVLSIARCVHTQVMKPLCNLSYNVGRPVSTAMYPSNNANLKRSETHVPTSHKIKRTMVADSVISGQGRDAMNRGLVWWWFGGTQTEVWMT